MNTIEKINSRLSRREVITAMAKLGVGSAVLAGLGASGLELAGCGSGKDEGALTVNRNGRFETANSFASKRDIGVNIGLTYIVLKDGIPQEMGLELPQTAIPNLEPTAFDDPDVYFLPLPPEADATPFKFVAFSNWANGHKPVGTGDPPHIHPLFGIAAPGTPSSDNHFEKAAVTNPDEIPEGYVLGSTIPGAGDTIASGIGEAYEYPTAPQLQPGWNTTAQNYFFYKGHMNAIGMGATYDFLDSHDTAVLPVTQPKLYPVPGWYPTKNTTAYDKKKKCHLFILSEFVKAERWI